MKTQCSRQPLTFPLELLHECVVELLAVLKRDEAVETLALDGVRTADHGRFSHRRVF